MMGTFRKTRPPSKGGANFAVRALLVVLAAVLAAMAAFIILPTVIEDRRYSDAAASAHGDGGQISLAAAGDSIPGIAAWLTVDGTVIDYPVMAEPADGPSDFYLHHDAWGNPSSIGCPYMDGRSDADGRHMVVYAHNVHGARKMFSDLHAAHDPAVFGTLGDASWTTSSGTATFAPLMAMTVDMSYGPIQEFSFSGDEDLRKWLMSLLDDADAVSGDAETLIGSAARVLSLVTCSSELSGGSMRTIVLFALT